jgi:hypothetical protein
VAAGGSVAIEGVADASESGSFWRLVDSGERRTVPGMVLWCSDITGLLT